MAESMKIDDRPGQEFHNELDSRSMNPEKNKHKDELTEEQVREVEHHLKEAEDKYSRQGHPGVVSRADFFKYVVYLARECDEDERAEAIKDLPRHLEKKAEHLVKYTDQVNEHFKDENRVLNDEGKKLLKAYREKTGEDRKKAAEELENIIEKRIQEKKDFGELITESPHFDENSPHSRALLKAYQEAQGPYKVSLKLRLLQEIQKLENVEKRCEKLYASANTWYEQGGFSLGERALDVSIKLADRYPNSPRLQVISEWSQRDMRNMQDHIREQKDVQGTQDEYDSLVEVGDLSAAKEVAGELAKKTHDFLHFTTDRNGTEVPRKDKYKTVYLQKLDHDARVNYQAVSGVEEDQAILDQEKDAERLKESLVDFSTNNKTGKTRMVEFGAMEEQLKEFDEEDRTDERGVIDVDPEANEDIEDLTDVELRDNKENDNEVVFDLNNNNIQRAERIGNIENVFTSVSYEGKPITNGVELKKTFDREAGAFTNDFVETQKRAGTLSHEALDEFQVAAQNNTQTGGASQWFQKESRKAGPDLIQYGNGRLRRTSEDFARDFVDQVDGSKDEPQGKIVNLAQKIEQERKDHQNQVRRAA